MILIQLLDLKERNSVESLWGLQPRPPMSLLHSQAQPHSRKDRERRPQAVRRSAPDSGVLIRLKAQMAEVRSKMSDVKSQVMEVRGAEPRPGASGGFVGEESPSQHGDSKPGELELLDRGAAAAAAARSRPCRHARKSLSPVLDSNGSLVVKRRSAEELEKELRGGDAMREHGLHLSEGVPKSEGPLQAPLLTLGGSSSEQASTSKQLLYGASGSRDDIFSLGGLSYLTSSKSCGTRSLGAAMLDSEMESSGTSHQTLLEGPSVQPQSTEGPSPSLLAAATSSDSDTEDEALQSSNSHYDNQTPPCTGEQLLSDDASQPAER